MLYTTDTIEGLFYRQPLAGSLLSSALVFLIPMLLLAFLLHRQRCLPGLHFGFPRPQLKKLFFAAYAGLAIGLLIVLIELSLRGTTFGVPLSIVPTDELHQSFGVTLFGVAVLPALLEEMYFRGILQPIYELHGGTAFAILLTAILYAMLHGRLEGFWGPVMSGIVYGYLAYELSSVWAAVVAHLCSNLLYLAVGWITDTYASFGILEYFSFLSVIGLLLCAYLLFRTAEELLSDDELPHFEACAVSLPRALSRMAFNPGAVVFLLAFFAKAVFGLI